MIQVFNYNIHFNLFKVLSYNKHSSMKARFFFMKLNNPKL